jgi:hypothetical protein
MVPLRLGVLPEPPGLDCGRPDQEKKYEGGNSEELKEGDFALDAFV